MGLDRDSKIQSFEEMAVNETQAGETAKEVVETTDNTSTDGKDEPSNEGTGIKTE